MTALSLWLALAAVAAGPTAFPEPTQFDPKPFAARLDDDALAVAYAPDGSVLAVGCADGTVRVWDLAARREIAKLTGHTNAVLAAAFLPDGRTLATGGADRLVKVWDVDTGRELGSHAEHRGAVRGVAVSPDG